MLTQVSNYSTAALLAVDGQICRYVCSNGTVINPKVYRSTEKTRQIVTGGQILEAKRQDFIGLVADFQVTDGHGNVTVNVNRGDKIYCNDGQINEVRPIDDGKPFYVTMGQIRIHTQRVAS